jgi:hypothetical protein
MKAITTEDQKLVTLLEKLSPYKSYKLKFAKKLLKAGYKDIVHCNGITIGRKGYEFSWYSDRVFKDCPAYGPALIFAIGDDLIKKVKCTANNFVFLTESGKVYDLKASVLHNCKNIQNLHIYFRWIDIPQTDSKCVEVEASRVIGSNILMQTEDGKVYGVGSNGHHQLANRDDTYGMRVANLVYKDGNGPFAAGAAYTVCSTKKSILVCGYNANEMLGVVKRQGQSTCILAPAVATQWRRCFGQVKRFLGLHDMVVILTEHLVYVSANGIFRRLDLPSAPKQVFGDASSNTFYVTSSSDVFVFKNSDKMDENDEMEAPDIDRKPERIHCGVETYPIVVCVDDLVFIEFDNFHVASSMSRMRHALDSTSLSALLSDISIVTLE